MLRWLKMCMNRRIHMRVHMRMHLSKCFVKKNFFKIINFVGQAAVTQ